MLDEKYLYPFRQIDHFHAPFTVNNFLTEEEIRKIHVKGVLLDPIVAGVSSKEHEKEFMVDPKARKGTIAFIPKEDDIEWLFQKMRASINQLNDTYFRFNLVALECFQYSIYEEGDHYDYHRDTLTQGINPLYEQRKLSFTIQLSDPDKYEGGDLEFYHPKGPVKAPRDKGSMTLFPSYNYHRVTPVTKGKRIALVGWIAGPDFI